MASADDLAPALARQTPAWATELLQLAKTSFVKNDPKNWEECKVEGDFTKEVPLWVLDFESMPIPTVFPLLTAVKEAKNQWFGERADQSFSFPPPGMVLEVAKYNKQLGDSDCGKLQRTNLDIVFFAWLMKFKEVSEAKENRLVAMFRKAALRVLMTVRHCENEAAKLARAYQLREDEEKNATIAGHSLLSRARELNSIQERSVSRSFCVRVLICALYSLLERCLRESKHSRGASAEECDERSCHKSGGLHGPAQDCVWHCRFDTLGWHHPASSPSAPSPFPGNAGQQRTGLRGQCLVLV